MLAPIIITHCFAALISWRLVGVVVTNADAKHRQDAMRLCGYIWGSCSIGGGLVSAAMQLHEHGVFAHLLQ
ncbi:hypothetical protein ACTG9Q_24780 [Actinokineospora sp. 24-640]